MTNTMRPPTTVTTATSNRPVDAELPARRLRTVLALNAATSFACGVAGLVAAPYWSDTLGIDSTGWIRVVSAGLVLFTTAGRVLATVVGVGVLDYALAQLWYRSRLG